MRLAPNIILIGFMGSGKSAVGRALAGRLRWRHRDTDTEIESEAGCTIADLFLAEGEAAFRQRETAILARLLTGLETEPTILSTGGGTPLQPESATLLKRMGTVIWLQASSEVIWVRVGPNLASRPLLAAYQDNPQARIESLLTARAPLYAAVADFALDTSIYARPMEAADQILSLLNR